MSLSLAQELAVMQARVAKAATEEEAALTAGERSARDKRDLALAVFLDGLTEERAAALKWDWPFWARPEQLAPADVLGWTVWLVLAGRGFGKTRTGSEWVRASVATGNVGRVALVARTPADARDVMIEGPAGILAASPPWERPAYEVSKRQLTWPNGATAKVFSGEQPDALRGPQQQLTWCDELCAYQYPQDTWDNIALSTRLPWKDGGRARTLVTTTPRPIKTLRTLLKMPTCVPTRGSTYENKANLDSVFLRTVIDRYQNTRLGRQELKGEVLDEIAGALWTSEMLERGRIGPDGKPDMQRIVVAVDPAVTSGADSSETGIVVAGLGVDGHLYVLADGSCRLRPQGWAARAVMLAEVWEADCIVAEVNNGGEMVAQTIRSVDPNVRVKMVRASRGKVRRAEPIVSFYEQGRAHHVGLFPELEDQQTSYTGLPGDVSPDRMDAAVWAGHELMLGDEVDYV